MREQLKPCPFCGSTELDDNCPICNYDDTGESQTVCIVVCCDKCNSMGPEGKTQREAIEAWNNRVGDTK